VSALPKEIGDGLVMRAATEGDADALAVFTADVLRGQDAKEPQASLGEWTRDLLSGAHPTARAGDATIIEDTRTGGIASAMFLLSHTWTYGGVRIAVGQPELVGTRAEYRGRGLVRAQFDVAHARSAARGDLMQAITGIPCEARAGAGRDQDDRALAAAADARRTGDGARHDGSRPSARALPRPDVPAAALRAALRRRPRGVVPRLHRAHRRDAGAAERALPAPPVWPVV
jgi:hypothetical protein